MEQRCGKRKAQDQPFEDQFHILKSSRRSSSTKPQDPVSPSKAERSNSPVGFLSLPRELRDIIYEYSLNYDGFQRAIDNFNSLFPSPRSALTSHTVIPQRLQTPNVLLLNRQVYAEASKVLFTRTLQIDRPIVAMDFEGHGITLRNAISHATLARIRHVRFDLSIWHFDKCIAMHASGSQDHSIGNWDDDEGESFLLYSDSWAVLLISCLDIWLEKNELESIEVVVHGSGRYSGLRGNINTTKTKLATMKAVVYACWGSQSLTHLIEFLKRSPDFELVRSN